MPRTEMRGRGDDKRDEREQDDQRKKEKKKQEGSGRVGLSINQKTMGEGKGRGE